MERIRLWHPSSRRRGYAVLGASRVDITSSYQTRAPIAVEVINDDREAPDFLLRDSDGLIGLELAQVFRSHGESGSPERSEEARRSKFLSRLADAYYARGGAPALVKMETAGCPAEKEIQGLADRLVKARRSMRAEATILNTAAGKYHVTALQDHVGEYRGWLCLTDRIGWVAPITLTDLEARIIEKAAKLPIYRRNVGPRVGLVLVADRTRASGMLRWDPAAARPDAHGFDALFLHIHPEQAHQLRESRFGRMRKPRSSMTDGGAPAWTAARRAEKQPALVSLKKLREIASCWRTLTT